MNKFPSATEIKEIRKKFLQDDNVKKRIVKIIDDVLQKNTSKIVHAAEMGEREFDLDLLHVNRKELMELQLSIVDFCEILKIHLIRMGYSVIDSQYISYDNTTHCEILICW